MKAVLVLPTYNEAENIKEVITLLEKAFKETKKHEMNILVVDDNSPDGTADKVRELQKKYKNIHLLMGKKQGLGVAYKRGFKHAIDKMGAEVIFEMDSDLSHPPAMIPEFMAAIDNGYDFVIGSRHIKGGGCPDWPFSRHLISNGGNFLARYISGLYRVKDCTSGFRAIRASILKKIDLRDVTSAGYSFQITLLHEAIRTGARVKEIPLVFYDRTRGKSKISKFDIIEFFFNAFKIRLKTFNRVLKFGIVGGSGIFVNTLFLWFFTQILGIRYYISSPFAIEMAIISNFIFHSLWTFSDKKTENSLINRIFKFHLTALGGAVINYAFLTFLTEVFGIYYLVSNLIGIIVAFAWNYLVNLHWTWRAKSYTLKKR